jgi:EAL domain-containing protein (putative c-di-GMP-specific phosphodiesterase class I)
MRSAIDDLLRPGSLTPLYQPIYRMEKGGRRVHGVECLMRGPRGSNFESAKILFEYVRLKREEQAVDRACVEAALMNLPMLPSDIAISINVHASTLGRDSGFSDFLLAAADRAQLPLDRLTIEVVEHAPPWDSETFVRVLRRLRTLGVKIALDDVGLGQSNFKMMVDAAPDFLKVDRYFVDGCHANSDRRAVIGAIQYLGRHFGAELVAEGVETTEDLDAVAGLGIDLVQGFLFSRPVAAADVPRGEARRLRRPPVRPAALASD